jgi:hypothetical protein
MESFDHILAVEPLYTEIELTKEDQGPIEKLVHAHFQIDCFCPDCRTVRTFTTHRLGEKSDALRGENFGLTAAQVIRDVVTPLWLTPFPLDFIVTLHCTRISIHVAKFMFRLRSKKLIKIGQVPSLADITSAEVRKYQKVLGQARMMELQRAVGLAAHGVGIGSFVYLRRIFESLIDEHKADAEKAGKKFPTWKKQRMAHRIKALSTTLPKFLVGNGAIHGLLSEGVHTKSEEECRRDFPVLKQAIMLILQLDNERREREQLEKSLTTELGRLTNSSGQPKQSADDTK